MKSILRRPFQFAASSKKNLTIVLVAGLTTIFAGSQVLHGYAATSKQNENQAEGAPIQVHSGTGTSPHKPRDLDSTINKLRSSASKLSLPSSMFEPWWRTMQNDPDASWILRNFDIMASDLDRRWSFPLGTGAYIPRLDTSEESNEIVIAAEVPGISESDLDVTVNDDFVTIKGDKRSERIESSDKNETFHSVERSYGSFERSIALPCKVESDKARATLKNGVLTIKVPKASSKASDGKKLTIERG